MTTDITELALIAKIKKQLENFDTVVLKEAEAKALVEALEKAQQRIAELESRTVKLPNSNDEQFWGYGAEFEVKLYDSCMFHALTAAGIKVAAE
ncbi:TPA: hypothetical protein NR743_005420 [Klebsiella pneumoniae]|nr:hypothetical protein [Klebsiella pneumoniae]